MPYDDLLFLPLLLFLYFFVWDHGPGEFSALLLDNVSM